MTLVEAAGVGPLIGLHAATWGAYKDSPYEGFRLTSYMRSILLASALAVLLAATLAEQGVGPLALVGTVYAVERLATEWWKSIVREQDQSRYTIPMRLACRGRPIDRALPRYAVGIAVAGATIAGLAWIDVMQHILPPIPNVLLIATVGSAGGWATAVGGAWKDAPIEGFSGWKFLRSPAIATAWAVPCSLLTDRWVTLPLTSAGFAAASIETYKTFLTGDRPPGKFVGQPIQARLPALRSVLAHEHAVLWIAAAAAFAVAVAAPADLLSHRSTGWLPIQLSKILLGAVALVAASLGAIVIYASTRVRPAASEPSEQLERPRSSSGAHAEDRSMK
jgi:hypothetical protein